MHVTGLAQDFAANASVIGMLVYKYVPEYPHTGRQGGAYSNTQLLYTKPVKELI